MRCFGGGIWTGIEGDEAGDKSPDDFFSIAISLVFSTLIRRANNLGLRGASYLSFSFSFFFSFSFAAALGLSFSFYIK